jgi:N-acetylmuramoyl-L-alanine amidase
MRRASLRLFIAFLLLTALWCGVVAPSYAAGVAIVGARIGQHEDRTRLALDLSAALSFVIDDKQAEQGLIVVDFPSASWQVGDPPKGRGAVVSLIAQPLAAAVIPGGGTRLLIKGAGSLKIMQAMILPPGQATAPHRFFLDVASGSRMVAGGKGQARNSVRKSGLPLIVLDPGHGGQDPGAATGNGTFEKEITLAVAKEVMRQIKASGRYRVLLTRDKDVFIPLRERAAIARRKGAELFISLHADSIAAPHIRGLSIYTLSEKASDREAETLAQRENQADALAGLDLSGQEKDVASILIGLSQRETMNQSRRFAKLAIERLHPDIAVLPSPLRAAGFAVLTAPDVPSVLMELGYLSHVQDAKLLLSAAHRKKLAASLVRALDAYFMPSPVKPGEMQQ